METNLTLMKKVADTFSVTRKVAKAISLLAIIAFVSFSFNSQAQTTLITTLGSVSACPGDDILVPVNVQNFDSVSSGSLSFTFDTSVMSPISCGSTTLCAVNLNPAITGTFLANATAGGVVSIGFFTTALPGISIGTGLLCNLRFHVKSNNGCTLLTWDPNPGVCIYSKADANASVIPSSWIGGDVCTSPSILVQPTDQTVIPGGNTSFSLTGYHVNTYQWQISTNYGALYTNLSDGGVYSGVTTNTLTLTGATLTMDTYMYRCILTGTCPSPYNQMYSNEATLTVSIPCPTAFQLTGGGNYCLGTAGANIGLSNSELGVTYYLSRGTTVVDTEYGTGSAINFGPQTTGTYTAVGTNSCGTTSMTGSLTVGTWSLPSANIYGSATPSQVCSGASSNIYIQFTGVKPFLLEYTDGIDTFSVSINSNLFPVTVYPSVTSTYSLVSVQDSHGCFGTVTGATATVTVKPSPVVTVSNNGPLCQGVTLFLNASGGIGYSWSGPNSFTSTTQNPSIPNVTQLNAGFYSVTVTGANSCTATGLTEVVITDPAPGAAGTISGPTTGCIGQSGIVYSIPVLSGATSYNWTVPSGVTITSGSSTNSITVSFGVGAVSGNISVYGSNLCGNGASANQFVNIGTVPTATSGSNSPVCEGNAINLTSGGGTSYLWSGPNGFTSSLQNPVIPISTLAASGTYSVTVSNTQGCTAIATTAVLVNAKPVVAASNNGPICAGQTLTLSAGGGTSYAWTGPGGYTGNGASVNIPNATIANSGLYTVVVTNAASCSASGNTNATVKPLPTLNASNDGPVCTGETANLNATGGTSYAWTGPGSFTSNLQNPVITNATAANAGIYTVVVTGTNLCSASTTTELVVNNNPVADAGIGQTILSGASTTLTGSATGGSGNYSYSWEPSALLVNSLVQNPQTIALTSTTTFSLVVTDITTTCVSVADEVIVTVNSPSLTAQIAVEPSTVVCAGATIGLTGTAQGGSGTYTFSWESNPAGFTANGPVVYAIVNENTVFTLTVNDGVTSITEQVSITVNPLPAEFNIVGGGSYCQGGQGALIELSGSEVGVTYNLLHNEATIATMPGTGNPLSFGYFTDPGEYAIFAMTANYCASSMNNNVNVVVLESPVADAGLPQTINIGSAVALTGSVSGGNGGYLYSWTPSELVIDPSSSTTLTTALSTTTTFVFTVTTGENCVDSDEVTITVENIPLTIEPNIEPNEICAGGSANISVVANGGSGSYTYLWASDPAGFTSTLASNTVNPVETTTYYVTVNDGYSTQQGSITLTVNPLPVVFNVSGGGTICAGEAAFINLSGSEEGTTYIVYLNDVQYEIINGTGNAIIAGPYTAPGVYTIQALSNADCPMTMNGGATIIVNPLPLVIDGNAGVPDCDLNGAIPIYLNTSVTGVNYELYLDGTTTGIIVPGTGSQLLLSNVTNSGLYTCIATDATTLCSSVMSLNVTINYTPLPLLYNVNGGGIECEGTAGIPVGLDGSELDVNYNLYFNGTATGISVPGNDGPISFGTFLQSGTYTVTATNPVNGCIVNMNLEAIVQINPNPVADAGNDQVIPYNTSTTLTGNVSGSTGNYSFAWEPAALLVDPNAKNPTTINLTSTMTFGLVVTNDVTGCVSVQDHVIVEITGGPVTLTASALPTTVCAGETVQLEAFTGGGVGAITTTWTSYPVGFTSNLTNPTVNPLITTTYYVEATDGYTTANDQVTVTVNPVPSVFTVTGGGSNCVASSEFFIELNGSESFVTYELYLEGVLLSNLGLGSGNPMSFGPYTTDGLYTIKGVALDCETWMTGEAVIQHFPLPEIIVNPANIVVTENGNGGFELIANNVDNYQWQESTDGGTIWNNIIDGGIYSNSATNYLELTGVSLAMDGYLYRCLVSNNECELIIESSAALLTVNQAAAFVTTTLPTLTECPGAIVIPVMVQDLNNVAAISLRFLYDPSVLTFTGFSNVNANLNDISSLTANGFNGVLTISHYSLSPSNIGTGTLVNLEFNYTGGVSDLTWDQSAPENCVYSDFDALPLPAVFVNGQINPAAVAPVILTSPLDVTIFDGEPASFNMTASGNDSFQWQESTDNGINWNILSDGGIYSGTTTATLSISAAGLSMDGYLYRCVVTENVCNIASSTDAATLNVNAITNDIMVYAGSATACAGETISIPVTTNNLSNIAAISLTLLYDPAVISYTGYSNLNPAFNPSEITINEIPGVWALSWYSLAPVSLNGNLLDLNFNYFGGTTDLTWDLTTPGNCEFNDYYGDVVAAVYSNGSVSPSGIVPSILAQPADQVIEDGTNATFTVTADNASAYQWQESVDGGGIWNDLTDAGIYSGTNTNTLLISGVTMTMSGNLYRVIVTNNPCQVISASATLTVTAPVVDIITTVGSAQACAGEQVTVPVNGQFLYNVAAISLTLNYNASVLTYDGYQNLNPIFDPSEITINAVPGQWNLSWYSLAPVTLVGGDMLELVFNYNGGTTDLTWNTVTSGACEYDDYYGNPMPAVYTNGNVTPSGILPLITNQPVDLAVNENDNATFSVIATNAISYQWQESVNGFTWNDLADGGIYSGTTTANLLLTAVNYTLNGNIYRCLITGDVCSVTTESAELTVYAIGSIVITTAGNVNACPGNEVLVPVNGQYLYDVAAISLTLNYNPAVLSFNSIVNLNPAINPGDVTIYSLPGDFRFSWYSLAPISLFNENLFDINFTYLGGNSDLTWDVVTPGNCEYDDYFGNPMMANYINGSAGPLGILPTFTTQPTDVTVSHGDNTTFGVVASNAVSYQWQISTDNGLNWNDLTDGIHYSGTTSDVLTVTDALYMFNGYQYRCMVTGDVCTVASSAAVLTVNPVPFTIITTAGSVDACPGNDIVVPVDVQDMYNVAAISIVMNYDPTVLVYNGYSNLNPSLADALISPTSGQFSLAWYSLTPLSLGDDHIIDLDFHYNGGTTNLDWDLVSQGYCEYTDYDGNVMAATFVNGAVNSSAIQPIVNSNPVDVTDFVGASAHFDVIAVDAVSYQWQVSADGGTTWTDITDGIVYSGALTATLSIPYLTIDLNNNLYHCVVSGTCDLQAISESALLTVISQPAIVTSIVSGSGCGPNINIAVNVEELNMITDYSLLLNYDEANFTFNGLANVNPVFAVGTINATANAGVINITYTGAPVYFGNGNIFELVFTSTGATGALSWDLNSSYTNIYGMEAPEAYVDGTVTVYEIPGLDVTSTPGICPQETGQITVNFTGGIAPWTFIYNDGVNPDVTITTSDPTYIFNVTPSATTTYTFTSISDGNACISTINIPVTVTVYPITSIVLDPANISLDEGGIATFEVNALNAIGYQWQVSTDNGATWTDLIDGGVYAGVLTNVLSVNGVTLDMDGYQYQCVVSGNCPVTTTSGVATLTVTPVIVTIAADVENCAGNFIVPITVEHLFGVAAFSLAFDFDNTVLDYVGYQNVNPQLTSGNIQIGEFNNQIRAAFFSLTPANIGDGLLFEAIFNSTGGNSNLTWDVLTPGSCEYQNLNGNDITSVFINGSTTVNPLPTITGYALPEAICETSGDPVVVTYVLTGEAPWIVSWDETTNGITTSHSDTINNSPVVFTINPLATITYTITSIVDNNGCIGTEPSTLTIPVNPLPVVTFVPFEPVCINTSPFTIIGGSPAGGTYSGAGISNNVFYPEIAGVGTFTLTYTFTNEFGCTAFATADVTVNPTTPVTIDPVEPMCQNAAPVVLNGTPAGGTFNGAGISGSSFDPSVAGVGTHTISYTYSNEFGCFSSATTEITVQGLPTAFPVLGGGSYCAGGEGLVIAVGGSEPGFQYHLYRDGIATGVVIPGTGSVLTYGLQTVAGTYTVVAVNPGTSCNTTMTGSVEIIINAVPTAYAGGYNIICQGGSAQMNVTVVGGTAPFNYQWTPATGISNPTIANPIASPNATAFYTVMVTDANGCTDIDNSLVIVNQSPVVNAGTDVTISIGTSTILNGSASGGVTPYTVSWTPGTNLSNPNIMNPVANPLVTTTYTLTVTGANGCSRSDVVTIFVSTSPLGYDIYGQVTYDNTISSPLSNVNVLLLDGATTVATSLTDANGNYTLPTVANGNYTTDGTSTKAWGGVNALDALKIARHFENLEPLTGLRFRAGDVDASGYINANDALLIMQRAVMMISSFPVNSDWAFEINNILVNGAPVPNNFKGICYGDANGSYIPPVKASPSVALDNNGVKYVESFSEFTLPVYAGKAMSIGAASLAIQFPADAIEITGVNTNSKAQGQLVYNVVDGVLYIEWYNLNTANMNANDIIFTITARSNNMAASKDLNFTVTGGSELGDANSAIIENAVITMPKLKVSTASFSLSDNYPNPFDQTTNISYVLPVNGQVNLSVYNHTGELVAVLNNAQQDAGSYTVEFDGSTLPQGVYVYKIEVTGQSGTFIQSKRMVITR